MNSLAGGGMGGVLGGNGADCVGLGVDGRTQGTYAAAPSQVCGGGGNCLDPNGAGIGCWGETNLG